MLGERAAIAVKLDSREGGDEELGELAVMLERAGVDLLEISGGNYESPAMIGLDAEGRELETEHESPFWTSAAAASAATEVPVMLTGGFRTRAEVERALATDVCAMIGVGRPLAVRPELAGRFVRGELDVLERPAPRLGGPAALVKMLGAASGSGWHRMQLARTADGRAPWLGLPAILAGIDYTTKDSMQALLARRSRMRLASRAGAPRPHPAPSAEPAGQPGP